MMEAPIGIEKEEIREFLDRFLNKAGQSGLRFIPRRKSLITIARTNLTVDEVKEMLAFLTEKDFVKGPMDDQDGSEGQVYVFAKMVKEMMIYIKLKLDREAKCLSFHECEYPVDFPFSK